MAKIIINRLLFPGNGHPFSCFVFLFVILFTSIAFTKDKDAHIKSPDLSGITLKGDTISLSDYKGKIVLVDFWASWCAPCREELPFLVEFYEMHKSDNFAMITVNIDNKLENVTSFLDDLKSKPSFPVLLDQTQSFPPIFKLQAMPTTLFIDAEGYIRFTHTGFSKSHKKIIAEELQILLKELKQSKQ
ncbi:MAG: TlpA family protein disulfide reductase [Fibrobacteria bacterium]|nr:TlpA family protein disulfide reductase [Fibrobacteria bacterium]